MDFSNIEEKLKKIPTWVWAISGLGIIVVAYLVTRGSGQNTTSSGGSADLNNALGGLQDAINGLQGGGGSSGGGSGGGSGGSGVDPTGGSSSGTIIEPLLGPSQPGFVNNAKPLPGVTGIPVTITQPTTTSKTPILSTGIKSAAAISPAEPVHLVRTSAPGSTIKRPTPTVGGDIILPGARTNLASILGPTSKPANPTDINRIIQAKAPVAPSSAALSSAALANRARIAEKADAARQAAAKLRAKPKPKPVAAATGGGSTRAL